MADRKISQLTEQTSPAAEDIFPIVDVDEAQSADRNKKITFKTIHNALPDGTAAVPSISFLSDANSTGLFRSGTNELGFTAAGSYVAKVTTAGFQVGTGTAAAQLHLFSTDTTDQVIIENTDAGLDTAPDLVLYRNSASPAASDNLGNLEFRGENSGGTTHAYAQVSAQIQTVTDGAEDGVLDLMTASGGTTASRLRLYGSFIGIGETTPTKPLHLTTSSTGTQIQSECTANDAGSGGDIVLFHRRGASGAGLDNDVLSTVFFRGKNDNSTPEELNYCAIEGSISDATDESEDGALKFKVEKAGTLSTQLEVSGANIGFFGATAAAQSTHVADITTTASTGTLPTANGTVTIANAASPTNAELLEYCVELEAKVEALLAFASAHGLMASS